MIAGLLHDQTMAFDISDNQIARTEAILRRKLPPVYRAILSNNNGGTAFTDEDQWDIHPIKDDSDRKRLSRSCDHVLAETQTAKAWKGFPSEALAVGDNGFGDVMFLLPSELDPSIFGERLFVFWHETGTIEPLAENLSAFEIE